jgi:hypothetical protein
MWYAGLLIIFILLDHGSTVSALALFAALLVYTLRPHPAAKKRLVAGWVVGGVGVAILGILSLVLVPRWVSQYQETHLIGIDQIQLLNLRQYEGSYLAGRIRNRSPFLLTGLVIQVAVSDGTDTIDSGRIWISEHVPPGEVREFDHCVYCPGSASLEHFPESLDEGLRRPVLPGARLSFR